MEAELREAFDRQERLSRELAQDIKKLTEEISRHITDSALRDQKNQITAENAVMAINQHKEEHEKKKGWWLALWGGVIVSVITSIVSWFTGSKSNS